VAWGAGTAALTSSASGKSASAGSSSWSGILVRGIWLQREGVCGRAFVSDFDSFSVAVTSTKAARLGVGRLSWSSTRLACLLALALVAADFWAVFSARAVARFSAKAARQLCRRSRQATAKAKRIASQCLAVLKL